MVSTTGSSTWKQTMTLPSCERNIEFRSGGARFLKRPLTASRED
jgi:hypothetical protein